MPLVLLGRRAAAGGGGGHCGVSARQAGDQGRSGADAALRLTCARFDRATRRARFGVVSLKLTTEDREKRSAALSSLVAAVGLTAMKTHRRPVDRQSRHSGRGGALRARPGGRAHDLHCGAHLRPAGRPHPSLRPRQSREPLRARRNPTAVRHLRLDHLGGHSPPVLPQGGSRSHLLEFRRDGHFDRDRYLALPHAVAHREEVQQPGAGGRRAAL